MSSLRARAAALAAATAVVIGAGVVASPAAGAHTCAQVRVHVLGSSTAIGSCHEPGTVGHSCQRTNPDLVVVGTGAGATACVPS